ncbi:MAG TPA: secretin N-terminal domain-containing protein [Thermoanaerobaculia bacterium]|nr:secretin N-terminal domain-containing protein [Thermoanaerobaculia bacterium]
MRTTFEKLTVLLLCAAIAAGCAHYSAYRQAEIAAQRGDWDEAVLQYMEALEQDPGNITYRAALMRAKIRASQEHFKKAKEYREAGVQERALVELQQAVQLDPTNQYAAAELDNVRQAIAVQRREPATLQELKEKSRGARPQPPILNPRSKEPISLNFPQPVSLFEIYQALGKAFGINILFDPNLKDQEIAIDLTEVDAQSALETLMRAANHFYKVLDEHTIIIAADTPQNRRTYEDLVIQTFFLSNAEVKEIMTVLRSLVDARKIAVNEQLNAIILRDTADKVKVAERIIESNDKSKAEVVVDVELLQINTSKLRDLGISLSNYRVTQSLDLGGENVPLRVSDLEFLNQSNWVLAIPNFIYSFIKQNGDAQLLAKPQLRITEGEKASLVIGDRVPIPLTTFNTSNTVGGNIVPITSFQYQDVGIRINIEPRVHHNREVTLKIQVEVSNLGEFVEGSGGQRQPIIGTRTFESVIRLQDGETNFLAGLIRQDETRTDSGLPGLSEIPVLGRLFSNRVDRNARTDVILTLTPHIIRNAEITEDDLLPIWVGTEANISFRGASPRVESDVEGPFEGDEGTPEEIQDAIRRRIQRLPRGLRPGEVEPEPEAPPVEEVPPPPGVDLVPTAPPTDIFREPEPPPAETPPEEPPVVEEEPPGGGSAALDAADPVPGDPVPVAEAIRLAASAGAAPAAAAAAEAPNVRLWLAPQALALAPGDLFEVRLQAASTLPVSHLPIALAFDPAVLAVEKVEAGTFLGPRGQAEVLADRTRPGELLLGASRLGEQPGVTGNGTVARITFRALAAGRTTVSFLEGRALDARLLPLAVAAEPAEVRVTPGGGRPARRPAKKPEG